MSGFVNDVLGIGQAGRLTIDALSAAGFDVIAEDLRPLDRGLLTRPPIGLPDGPIWLIHANPSEARIALFRHNYATWKDRYRIGYWVWESSIAPRAWTKVARWFHEIWTPSEFARNAFAQAFERYGQVDQVAKLRVVPHPVQMRPPYPRVESPVRALTLFDPRSDFDRKNPYGAIDAWLRAFPKPGPARLIIKSLGEAEGHPRLKALRQLVTDREDIEIRAETLTQAATEDLISRSNILISLHRAEGFGLSLAEAMASGVTVIATGWSGNMQFMTTDNSLPVPYRMVPANARYNGPDAKWAEPDLDAAAALLHQAIHASDLRLNLGAHASRDIASLATTWTRDALFPETSLSD